MPVKLETIHDIAIMWSGFTESIELNGKNVSLQKFTFDEEYINVLSEDNSCDAPLAS